MSDTPDDESGNSGQGRQPEGGQPQGGQPQGGQDSQPQGGAPQGGQPQGGQDSQPQGGQPQGGQPQGRQPQGQPPQGGAPQGGQPQGGAPRQGSAPQGQPAGQAPVNTGPGIGDIFSRNDTLDEIKFGVALYALVGFGIGLPMFGLGSAAGGSQSLQGLGAAIAAAGSVGAPIAVSAVLGLLLGDRIGEELSEVPDNLVFATAGVVGVAGGIVTFLISWVMLGIGAGSVSFNNFILPLILTGVGAAIIAVGRIWIEENLIGQSVPPQQPPQQQQY